MMFHITFYLIFFVQTHIELRRREKKNNLYIMLLLLLAHLEYFAIATQLFRYWQFSIDYRLIFWLPKVVKRNFFFFFSLISNRLNFLCGKHTNYSCVCFSFVFFALRLTLNRQQIFRKRCIDIDGPEMKSNTKYSFCKWRRDNKQMRLF